MKIIQPTSDVSDAIQHIINHDPTLSEMFETGKKIKDDFDFISSILNGEGLNDKKSHSRG